MPSLSDAIAATVDRQPDRPAVETDSGQVVRYRDLDRLAGQAAAALQALGVQPGDRVAVQVEKSFQNLVLFLGAVRAGAVYLPLNTGYTPAELGYFLADAEPRLFVCRPEDRDALASVAEQSGARVETLGAAGDGTLWPQVEAAAPVARVPRATDDLAAILYTSGTTGRSKGAMLSHGNLVSNAQALVEAWRFTADDRLLQMLPIYHTHGLFVAVNTCLLSGASMILLPRFDAALALKRLADATVMMGVPTFYTRLLAQPGLTRDAVGHVRLFVSGSAPLSAETHKEFQARTGHAILERYGMTETGMITSNRYDGERRPGAVGAALPGVAVRIADPQTGRVLPTGEVGVIEVRGPNVFQGYWRQPEKTAAEMRPDGFFVTGDMGHLDETGYVTIVGRAKDLIISGGLNIYPAEVEGALDALPGVAESAVIGVPHPDFGEGVVGVLARRPGAALDEAQVLAALGQQLARFKLPKRVVFVDALPRNAMGKIQKAELRRTYAGLLGE